MGANLCCMSLSTSDFDESKAAIREHERKPPPSRSMLSCITRSRSMKKEASEEEKKRDLGRWLPPEKKAMKMCKLATLEEWILSSPGMKPADYISGGELHVFKQSSKMSKVRPSSSSRVHAELISSSPGDSIISLKRIDEEDNNYVNGDRGRGGGKSLEVGSQSGKPVRKVNFRWPEADIILFYSSEGTSEEIDKLSP